MAGRDACFGSASGVRRGDGDVQRTDVRSRERCVLAAVNSTRRHGRRGVLWSSPRGHAGSELRGVREIPPAHGWAGTDSTPWTTVELWARPRRAEPELRAIPPTQHRRFRAQRRRSAATTVRAVARFRRPVRGDFGGARTVVRFRLRATRPGWAAADPSEVSAESVVQRAGLRAIRSRV